MSKPETITESELTTQYHQWLDALYTDTPWGVPASKILQMCDPLQYQVTRRDFEANLDTAVEVIQ
ncbi:MAG: hypothetical protein KAI17_03360 [Thiotrichaceae bacterium]|nr:hypothetical protein [Thiotrichaceae bacterium]